VRATGGRYGNPRSSMTKPQRWDRWKCPHCHHTITMHIYTPDIPGHRCEDRDEHGRLRGWLPLERAAVS
jgi:hypothetical protein